MKHEIRSRLTGVVLFAADIPEDTERGIVRIALEQAVEAGADLRYADLSDANLSDADLRYANLSGAYLHGAKLINADLSNANLYGANLVGASLSGANLGSTNLTPIRDDLWAVLSSSPAEVPALIAALKAGKVDGSTYEGECACLVGTLANARDVSYRGIQSLTPNSARPIERFFMSIRKGDTPDTNEFSKLALEWSQEWLDRMQTALAAEVDLDEIDTGDLVDELRSRGLDPEEAVGASPESLKKQQRAMLRALWGRDDAAVIEMLKTYLCDCLGRAAV